MTELLLKRELEPAAQEQRRMLALRRLTLWWFLLAAAAVIATVVQLQSPLPAVPILLGIGAIGAIGALAVPSARNRIDYKKLARNIAAQHPELHALLVTAVEQERDPQTGRMGFLQERVMAEALTEIRQRENIQSVAPRRKLRAQALHFAALALFVTALFGMPRQQPGTLRNTPRTVAGVTVNPGDALIERGSALVVLATFGGQLPSEATLVVSGESGERRFPLAKNLNDPVFGGSVPEINSPVQYRVEYTGGRTPDYKVTVFDYPRLERADAALKFPEYTGLEPKAIRDTRRVSGVEGSTLDLTLHLNKKVSSARLIAKDKTSVPLTTSTNGAQAQLSGFKFESSQRYMLQLVDADGRTNKIPAEFAFDVLTNQRPSLRLAFPRGDQRVSALQEMLFEAEAQDDYGLRGWGLSYSIGGAEPTNLAMGASAPAHSKTNFRHFVRLEELNVQPDQLVSYHLWADDFGPDGKLRRTSSDLFFSEVRAFEEIFREGEDGGQNQQQQQQQQQGQQGQSPATKLAELQKQVINATWKLQRTETGSKPSEKYEKDVPVVRDGQAKAIEQLEALDANIVDLRMKEYVQAAEKHMSAALDQLEKAQKSTDPLPKALSAEQAAYQALLKLQSREHQVTQAQNQNRNSRNSQQQRNQAQLNQLDLKRQQNPYETQREAAQQQPQQNQEQLEVLNRLKELAERQQDINERLKELQTELQAAKTPERQEELQRELKRLREEQREMLADMDELQQKMDQPQNSSQMAESREQLEQARQQAEQASQALEQNRVPQALSSGTRAERQLEEMRDEMRKSTSGQFAEEMRDMRNEAREIAEKEQEIQKQMQQAAEQPKALSDNGKSQEIAKQLAEQKQAVTNLTEQMRRVTEQSETAEPLLSKQLYDSLRRNSQSTLDRSLSAAQELTSRNFLREAQPFEQRAAKDIDLLKREVEMAAESVLGDETEALRNAKRELDQLTEQLQRELARAASTNSSLSNAMVAALGPGTNNARGTGGGTNGTQRTAARQGTNGPQFRISGGTNENFAASSGTNGRSGRLGTNGNALASSQREGGARTPGREGHPSQGQQSSNDAAGNERQRDLAQANQQESSGQQQREGQGQQGGGNQQGGNQSREGGENDANPQTSQANEQTRREGGSRGDRLANMFDEQSGERRRDAGGYGGESDGGGPITSENFAEWSRRLSNVEEMLDRPTLRNRLAQARDRARATRTDFKRHSKNPQWDLVWNDILKPMVEVRERVADELSRRESSDSLAPIDRDPVPGKYGELVRRYYENLGGAQ
jgi:hypothetical protein